MAKQLAEENDRDDSDDDDEDGGFQMHAMGRNSDMRESFGKRQGRSAGGGQLAQMKAKLSLQEELGALKSELSDFDKRTESAEQQTKEALKASSI